MLANAPLLLALRVGTRYIFSRRKGINRITNWVSFLGLVFGISLLIVVLSVYNGATRFVFEDFLEIVPHAVIYDHANSDELKFQLIQTAGIRSVERFIDLQVLVRSPINPHPTHMTLFGMERAAIRELPTRVLRRAPKSDQLPDIAMSTVSYLYPPRSDRISLSVPVATPHGISVKSASFQVTKGIDFPEGLLNRLLIVDIDYLLEQGLIHPEQVQWKLVTEYPFNINSVVRDIPNVVTWTSRYGGVFQAFAMEKTILFVLLMFVVGLASLNVVSGQANLINRKNGDIAIFQTMGAERRWVTLAFLLHGLVIVGLGVIGGLILGSVLAHFAEEIITWVVNLFQDESFAKILTIWQGSSVELGDLIWTSVASLIVGVAAVLWPLSLVYKKDPVDSLRRTM